MVERRGLGAAMTMTPEKIAFIKGGPAVKPVVAAEPVPTEIPPVVAEAAVVPATAEPSADFVETPRPRPNRPSRAREAAPARSRPREDPEQGGGFYGQILVPLTTRLHPRTADALRRACLEQKLARQSPNTQQEIVELALKRWLSDNDFLDA